MKGLGTDIIEIERIRNAYNRFGKRFLDRIFTAKEQVYCKKYKDPSAHLAARFAAKEAVAKALGTGFQNNFSFLDIEILNDDLGKPLVYLSDKLYGYVVHVTLSHCREYATATAVWE